MKKKWLWLLFVGGLISVVYLALTLGEKPVESKALELVEKTVVVEKGDIVIDFVSDGNVEIPIYDLSFETTGTVEAVNVKVGDYVEAGTVLAELAKSDLERDLLEAELDLETALKQEALNRKNYSSDKENAAYQAANLFSTYKKEKESLEIMQTLSDSYAQQDIKDQAMVVDQAYAAYENHLNTSDISSDIQIELDAIAVNKARMKVEEIQENIEGMTITANVSGWIVAVNYAKGEITESAEPVILIEEDGPIYVKTNVAEEDIGDVQVGQKATFEADAVSGMTYTALVEQVSRAPQIGSNGLVSYEVLLKADDVDRQLMDGMTSTVHFILIEKTDVLLLPNEAIVKKNGGQYVTVRVDDQNVEEQKVYAGFTDGVYVEILSGIDQGTIVVYEE